MMDELWVAYYSDQEVARPLCVAGSWEAAKRMGIELVGSGLEGYFVAVDKVPVVAGRDIDAAQGKKDVLLRAAYDLLTKCHRSRYVLDIAEQTAYYNGGQHDGRRLRTDIASALGLDDYEHPIEAPR